MLPLLFIKIHSCLFQRAGRKVSPNHKAPKDCQTLGVRKEKANSEGQGKTREDNHQYTAARQARL